jgi:predicted ATPase
MLWDVLISNHQPCSTKLRSLDSRPNNLPQNTVTLYGRTSELDQLRILFTEQQIKLVTITGAGGIGKTSIGIELAKNLIPLFSSGVFMVDISGITDPSLVIFEIIENLGLRESQEQNPIDFLCSYLKNSHLLLFIDNFEQVLGAKDIIKRLISACKSLKILITSRQPLGLPLEKVFRLNTLSLPSTKDLNNLDIIAANPCVQLFVERSKQAVFDFELNKNNAKTIALICRQLEGLALAIEIAASRTKILSPQQILDRLTESLSLLGETRSPIKRHRTVFSTVEWSYNMLYSNEKNLLDAVSVFRGGFLLETLEHISPKLTRLNANTLDILSSLIDKSLVRLSSVSGVYRFNLLEPIRQFAIQKLEEKGFLHETSDIFARYYLEMAEEKSHMLQTSQQKYVMTCGHLEKSKRQLI